MTRRIECARCAGTTRHERWCPQGRRVESELRRSEAYQDDPKAAARLWDAGYRPMPADALEVGMQVAYRDTDVFQLGPTGPVKYSTVLAVRFVYGWYPDYRDQPSEPDEYPSGVHIEHTGGADAEEDPETEVWAKTTAPAGRREGAA